MDTDETQMGNLELDAKGDGVGFPHKETTAAIIGAAFEVHQQLGYGFLERVYQRALQVELLQRGLAAESEKQSDGSL